MTQPLCEEDCYRPTNYYHWRKGDVETEHCVGTSCDNLVAIAQHPTAPEMVVTDVSVSYTIETVAVAPRPGRSEPLEGDYRAPIVHPVPCHVQACVQNVPAPADYYSVLRRRSQDGRPELVEEGALY